MASTPTRSPARKGRGSVSPAPKASPGPCPYKPAAVYARSARTASQGMKLVVPGDIFKVPDTDYKATVKGWNDRSTDSVVVKFDDGSQYWFPLEDVLKWSSEPQSKAASPEPEDPGLDSSPASGRKAYNLRKRSNYTPTTAPRSRRTPPVDKPIAPDSTVKETASQSKRPQQAPLQQETQQQVTGLPQSLSVAGMLAGVVLLLVVMLVAITAVKGAAHDLESVLDSLNQLYSGVGAMFKTRHF